MAATEHAKQKSLESTTTRSKETSVTITANKDGIPLEANNPAKFLKQLDNITLPASYVLSTESTVTGIPLPAPITYTWSYSLDTDPTGWTVLNSETTSSLTVTAANFNSYITGTATSVTFRVQINKTGFVTSEDYYTIYYFDESKDVVVATINNPNVLIPSGTPTDFSNTGCEINVTVNGVKIPYGISGANSYSIGTINQEPSGSVTLGTPSTSTDGFTRIYSNITEITQDTVTITFPITVRNQFGTAKPVVNLTQKFILAKTGANAKAISLSATAVSFSYSAANALLSPASSTVTITPANITVSPWYWTVTIGAGTESSRTSSATATTYSYTPQASFTNMPQTLTFKAYEVSTGGSVVATASIGMAATRVGDAGIPNKSVTVFAYIWSNLASPGPTFTSTSFNYTWSDGTISAYPTNAAGASWTASAGASPGNGYTLYAIQKTITDLNTATVTATSWSGAVKSVFGYTEKGDIGFTGQGHYIAYIAANIGTTPATPGAGTAYPPTGWSSTPVTLTEGQVQFQSDGFTETVGSNTITWKAPYQSYLKVGSLQAVSANLGIVDIATGGSLRSGKTTASDNTNAGFYLGNESNVPKFFIGNAGDTNSFKWDGTNVIVKGGTLTGSSFATASGSGQRVTINSGGDNRVKGYNGSNSEIFSIGGDGTGTSIFSNADPVFKITTTWDAQTFSYGVGQRISVPYANISQNVSGQSVLWTRNYSALHLTEATATVPNEVYLAYTRKSKTIQNYSAAEFISTLGTDTNNRILVGLGRIDGVANGTSATGYGARFAHIDNSNVVISDAYLGKSGGIALEVATGLFKWGNYSYNIPDGSSRQGLLADGTWKNVTRSDVYDGGGSGVNLNSLTNNSSVGSVLANYNATTSPHPFGVTTQAWYHLINIRHRGGDGDGNVYGAQIAIGLTGSTRSRMAFRAQVDNGAGGSTWDSWTELATTTSQAGVTSIATAGTGGLSVNPSSGAVTITLNTATTSAAGAMSSTDKSKLDGIATGATANVGTVTSVSGTGTVSGLTLSGTVNTTGNLTLGGTLSLTSANVTGALGYTPYNSTNPNGYTSNTGTVTSVSGTGTVSGLTLSGTVTNSGNLTLGGTLSVTASNFAAQTAKHALVAPNAASGVPTFRQLLFSDIDTSGANVTAALIGTSGQTSGVTNVTFSGSLSGGASGTVSWTMATASGASTAAIAINVSSDQKLKKNITNSILGLDFINKLRPVSYNWNHEALNDGNKTHYGFIAQEVETLVGSNTGMVGEITQGNLAGYKSFSNEGIVAALVKAVQELTEKVKQLEQGN